MRTRVVIGAPVKAFMNSLAPEPRRKLRRALKELGDGKGDLRQLEGKLAPFWKLRVQMIRVIFDQKPVAGERVLLCFFADYRGTVSAILEQLLASGLLEQLRD